MNAATRANPIRAVKRTGLGIAAAAVGVAAFGLAALELAAIEDGLRLFLRVFGILHGNSAAQRIQLELENGDLLNESDGIVAEP